MKQFNLQLDNLNKKTNTLKSLFKSFTSTKRTQKIKETVAYKEALPQLIEEVKPKPTREQRKREYIKRQPKNKFHIEVKAYYEKSYKQRNNLWSVPKVEKDPVILSKTVEATAKKKMLYNCLLIKYLRIA